MFAADSRVSVSFSKTVGLTPLQPHGSEMTRPWGFFMRRWLGVKSLSGEVARDPVGSHDRPSYDPILAQTLGRLSVSRSLG